MRPAFQENPGMTIEEAKGRKVLLDYQEICYHMVFDIKINGNFTQKARFVASRHTTEALASIMYTSVVLQDRVRISFLVAALNNLGMFAADIGNAYLNADSCKKI